MSAVNAQSDSRLSELCNASAIPRRDRSTRAPGRAPVLGVLLQGPARQRPSWLTGIISRCT